MKNILNAKEIMQNKPIYEEYFGDDDLINPIKTDNDLIRAIIEVNKPYYDLIEPVGDMVKSPDNFSIYEFYAYKQRGKDENSQINLERPVFFKRGVWEEDELRDFIDLYVYNKGKSLEFTTNILEKRGVVLLYKNYEADTICKVLNGLFSKGFISIDRNGTIWDYMRNFPLDYQSVEDVFEHAGVEYYSPLKNLNNE